ncbi:MAG: hypothetical protein JWM85_3018 [Acidimicrobiaceae bacterium]|nr:hypothetical protein [Acidimicrobiaceae bacterium]
MSEPRPVPITSGQLTPEELATRSFATVRKGFDPQAVRRFLEEAAAQLRVARASEGELRSLLEDAERRAAAPVLDEATLTAAVGAETVKVLQAAHQAANEVTAKAESRAAGLLAQAEGRLAEANTAAAQEAERLRADARREIAENEAATRQECRAMVEEAREARRRILADLAARRRDLHVQLEQIRAAKDSLVSVVDGAAAAVEKIRGGLLDSEEDARHAAEGAAQTLAYSAEDADDEALEQLVAEALAGDPPSEAADQRIEEPAGEQPPYDLLADERPEVFEPAPGGSSAERTGDEAAASEAPTELAGELSAPGATVGPETEVALEEPDVTTHADGRQAESSEPAGAEQDGVSGSEPPDGVAEDGSPDGVAEEQLATEAPANAVDELFARIRASRAEDVAQARAVLEPESHAAPSEATPIDGSSERAGEDDAEAGAAEAGAAEDGDAEDGDAEDGDADNVGVSSPTQRRDALLSSAQSELSRSLKRALRSEQNEVLAVARGLSGEDLQSLLPGEETAGRMIEASEQALLLAWQAGIAMTGELLGNEEATVPDEQPAELNAVAEDLASEVVGRIRDQLEKQLARGGGEGAGTLVGTAYREWKGERIDRLAGDFAGRAFSLGMIGGAARSGALVEWSLGEAAQPCPDCDDNALAGPLAPGQEFPAGAVGPPLHPGCRCMLVPTDH